MAGNLSGKHLLKVMFYFGSRFIRARIHPCKNPSMHTCRPEAQTRRSSFLLLVSSASFFPCGCSAHSRGWVHECRPPSKSTASPIRPAFISTTSPSLLTPPVCHSPPHLPSFFNKTQWPFSFLCPYQKHSCLTRTDARWVLNLSTHLFQTLLKTKCAI